MDHPAGGHRVSQGWAHSRTRDGDGWLYFGAPLELTASERKVFTRVKWAVRQAGYKLPRMRWRWVERIYFQPDDGRGYRVYGLAWSTPKSGSLVMTRNTTLARFADTILHELAHVLASGVEADHHPHEHSDLWGVINARLYRAYFDRDSDGPEYVHYR